MNVPIAAKFVSLLNGEADIFKRWCVFFSRVKINKFHEDVKKNTATNMLQKKNMSDWGFQNVKFRVKIMPLNLHPLRSSEKDATYL